VPSGQSTIGTSWAFWLRRIGPVLEAAEGMLQHVAGSGESTRRLAAVTAGGKLAEKDPGRIFGRQITSTLAVLLVVSQSIAIGIGFLATKFCTLVVGEKLRKKISTLSNVTIGGSLQAQPAAQATNSYALAAAVALGPANPALIIAFMRLGAALWFDCQNRTVYVPLAI
jgi:hypothetical protein